MTEMFNNRSNKKPPPQSVNTQPNPYQPQPTTNTTPFATRAASLISNWGEEGHPSQHVAESIASIYDPKTLKANRTAIYMSLQNHILQTSPQSNNKRTLDQPSNSSS